MELNKSADWAREGNDQHSEKQDIKAHTTVSSWAMSRRQIPRCPKWKMKGHFWVFITYQRNIFAFLQEIKAHPSANF